MRGSKGTKVQWEDQKERKYNERIKRNESTMRGSKETKEQ